MKLKNPIFVIIGTLFFFSFSGLAQSAGELVQIESINAQLVVRSDGAVQVTENIVANFNLSPGHGIYRDIPYVYQDKNGKKSYTEIEVIDAYNDSSEFHQYELIKNDANLRIKIGDPDVLVYGTKNYKIIYTVKGIILPFDNYDELYWNVVGTGWISDIGVSSATVILPDGSFIQGECYAGPYGSNNLCDKKIINGNSLYFETKNIPVGGAFTVAVGFKKGTVPILTVSAPPSLIDSYFTLQNIIIFLLTVIVGIFGVIRLWWRGGRDIWWDRKSLFDPNAKEGTMPLGGHETIVAEYEPPEGLRPAEIGVLKDETADTLDVSATIVDLAVRGYLKIIEVPKKWMFGSVDYELQKMKEPDDKLMKYEHELLDALFEEKFLSKDEAKVQTILLSKLKNKFYTKLNKIKDLLYKEVVDKKLFTSNPKSTRTKHGIFAALLIGASTTLLFSPLMAGFGFGLLIVSVAYLIIGLRGMVQRTAYGRELYRKVKGYELFLSNTEKYRQPFFEKENTFMNILPYAMVFGVTKKLSKAMKDMGIRPHQPVWFVGHAGAFNIEEFGSSMDSFSNSLSTAIASTPGGSGSGGGGFSGGGGGGGGGGGW